MYVFKKNGTFEKYDKKKIYRAAYEACINAHLNKKEADETARAVTQEVNKRIMWIKAVKSDNLFQHTIASLKKRNPDAAFLYATHRDVS